MHGLAGVIADMLGMGMTHFPGLVGTAARGSANQVRVLQHSTRISAAQYHGKSAVVTSRMWQGGKR
jgi:hypothetical protein